MNRDYDRNSKKSLVISLLVIAVILLLSVIFLLYSKSRTTDSRIAYIYQSGELIDTIDLNAVTSAYTFQVDGENGISNTIEVRPGEIGIIEASCPDHLCIETGFIDDSTMPVVCLPNELIIEIKNSDTDENGADSYSY